MKIKLTYSLFIIFSFTSFTIINAATVTWLGADASWNNASQWDTGTVPSFGDDVIIPYGSCRINSGDSGGAYSVKVESTARLYIHEDSYLGIKGTVNKDGLHNRGRVYIYGTLDINEITKTISWLSSKAIRNDKIIVTYPSSKISIKYIDDLAIENYSSSSYFKARGEISISSISTLAIRNEGRFYNYGKLNIQNNGENSGTLMVNIDDFRNYSTGVMNLHSNTYAGISNLYSSSSFRNDGEINVINMSVGILNNGYFSNSPGAHFISENSNSTGFYNSSSATILNKGTISANYSQTGMKNYGLLINKSKLTISNSGHNGGLRNYQSGRIENHNDIVLDGSGSRDLDNDGEIYNFNGGTISVRKKIDMSTGSSFYNYGFLISYGNGYHIMNSTISNKGVIDDDHGNLLQYISNNKVVVAPTTGQMQVGIPFSNVLDVSSLTEISIGDWKVSPNGPIAGVYDASTNKFTPNSSAIGIKTIYITIQNTMSGVSRDFTLELDGPIDPFTPRRVSSTRNGHDDFDSLNPTVTISPNPTSGNISLSSSWFENHNAQVYIFNSLGQVVQQVNLQSGTTQSIDFNSQLTNGMYFVKIVQGDKEIDMKRIQLFR